MEKKYRYLIKNIGLLSISNLGTKILSFLLVPVFTNYLTTEEYGVYELVLTTIFLLIPILSLNITDGIMRFLLEKKFDTNEIFKIGFLFCISAYVLFILLIFFSYDLILFFRKYGTYLIIYYGLNITSDFLIQFLRGLEKVKEIVITNIISSILISVFTVYFLIVLKKGLNGYFIANYLGFFFSILYMIIKLKIWTFFSKKKINYGLAKEIIRYSIPIGIGNIGWWITNISDRYIVTSMRGIEANGVYSVAYKIPSLLVLIQIVFNQAWLLSAIKEFDKEKEKFYKDIYKIYNYILIFSCSILLLFNKCISAILFKGDFYNAWKYAPFLILSVVFSSLAQFLGGILAAAKESIRFGKSILIGAAVNTFLNVVLIKKVGVVGAAIATAISYLVIWIIRTKEINKILDIKFIRKKDCFNYFLLIVQASLFIIKVKHVIAWEIVIVIVIVIINSKEIYEYLNIIKNKFLKGEIL